MPDTPITPNIAAIIKAPHARLQLSQRPIPTPGPGQIVVRNHAVAANNIDWMFQEDLVPIQKFPNVLGADLSGIVTAVGPGITKFAVGDRVGGSAAFIYNKNIDHGAWQTYTILRELATFKLPSEMSFEEGATFPTAFSTAACALFVDLELSRSPAEQNSSILVWGASASVGTGMVQMAHSLGYNVFATASPQHHEYIKTLGATEVFDYHSADVEAKIIAAAKEAGTAITMGFDAVSSARTVQQSAKILSQSGGKSSKLVLVHPRTSQDELPGGIETLITASYRVFVDKAEVGTWLFNDWLTGAIEAKKVVAAPHIVNIPGGVSGAQLALDKQKAGVSCQKLVVTVN